MARFSSGVYRESTPLPVGSDSKVGVGQGGRRLSARAWHGAASFGSCAHCPLFVLSFPYLSRHSDVFSSRESSFWEKQGARSEDRARGDSLKGNSSRRRVWLQQRRVCLSIFFLVDLLWRSCRVLYRYPSSQQTGSAIGGRRTGCTVTIGEFWGFEGLLVVSFLDVFQRFHSIQEACCIALRIEFVPLRGLLVVPCVRPSLDDLEHGLGHSCSVIQLN